MKTSAIIKATFLIFIAVEITSCRTAISPSVLPVGVPEAEGVSSRGIIDFLDAARLSSHEFHSLVILRHGRVVAEGWWAPYAPGLKHTLYSLSKSFTATAVGFAVSEKKLSVDDRVIAFFPGELPDSVSPYLAAMRVKDLLSMSAGQEPDPTFRVVTADSNWVKSFLATPVLHEPGTEFLYNTLATYMLSAIVQKVTGERIVDYLKPRLFDPLAIEGMDWELDPQGINTGGWGLRLRTGDLAKFGQLFLQKGKWNGKQVLPEAWIEEATTMKILQDRGATQAARDSSDWLQGYCYQMWRCRHNGYRGDGAYGQYVIVLPEKDAVIAITSETADMQAEINMVWKYLLPAFRDTPLPEDNAAAGELKQRLTTLALPLPDAGDTTSIKKQLAGKKFSFQANSRNLEALEFRFEGTKCSLGITSASKSFTLDLGAGTWIEGETGLTGPNLLLLAKAHNVGLPPAKIAGCFGVTKEGDLKIILRFIESPHTETITCRIRDKYLEAEITDSNDPGHPVSGLLGTESR